MSTILRGAPSAPPEAVWAGPPWPGVRSFCTRRGGGASRGPYAGFNLGAHVGDAPRAVAQNRARLRAWLPGEPQWLDQVHGARVHVVRTAPAADAPPPAADALVTTLRAQPLAVLTADCLSVVIADAQATALGVAHAGWRGLAGGVLENTLAALRALCPQAGGWRAWLGPAIGPQAFQVGADVRDAFTALDPALAAHFTAQADGAHWLADLPGLATARLRAAGVATVVPSGVCTVRTPEHCYSYRRDGRTGRQATLAWLAPAA